VLLFSLRQQNKKKNQTLDTAQASKSKNIMLFFSLACPSKWSQISRNRTGSIFNFYFFSSQIYVCVSHSVCVAHKLVSSSKTLKQQALIVTKHPKPFSKIINRLSHFTYQLIQSRLLKPSWNAGAASLKPSVLDHSLRQDNGRTLHTVRNRLRIVRWNDKMDAFHLRGYLDRHSDVRFPETEH
jgi:hypothetical protein